MMVRMRKGLYPFRRLLHPNPSNKSVYSCCRMDWYNHDGVQLQTKMCLSSSSSVEKEEVLKFSNLASTWWDPKSNPLLYMNAVRMKFIVDQYLHPKQHKVNNNNNNMYQPLAGCKALDVGCGGGVLSESLARLGAQVTAIDPSSTIVTMAQQRYSTLSSKHDLSIDYRGGISIEQLVREKETDNPDDDDDDNLYDIICILEVLEHSTTPRSILDAATKLLKKPNGLLFVSTINRTAKSYALAILGAEYALGLLPPGTHSWNQFLTPTEVQNMLQLQQASLSGMVLQPPFLDITSWKLDPTDTDVNWIASYQHKPSSSQSNSNQNNNII